MSGIEYDSSRNLPKIPNPPPQPEFPNLHPNYIPSPVNYHRFDNVPRPYPWHDVLVHYANAELYEYLNALQVPHYSKG